MHTRTHIHTHAHTHTHTHTDSHVYSDTFFLVLILAKEGAFSATLNPTHALAIGKTWREPKTTWTGF